MFEAASIDSAFDLPDVPAREKVETREDLSAYVMLQCEQAAVPLRLEQGDFYLTVAKPLLDRIIASAFILLLLPVLLAVALSIKLADGGPVFFVQMRTGYLGRRFALLKFRTMIPDADKVKSDFLHLNVHGTATPDFKAARDPRVTRLGRVLRSTSLDELPNLFNVLRGDLSLVGPRPTSFEANSYSPCHLPRLAVRPGVTGLWQVSGRATIGFDRRCELDMEYIRRASAWTDSDHAPDGCGRGQAQRRVLISARP
jgi:lipopolysaccharide/colanic/teichoic acid biosynthesis glycosyltransferase